MKKLAAFILLSIMIAGTSFAQTHRSVERTDHRSIGYAKREYGRAQNAYHNSPEEIAHEKSEYLSDKYHLSRSQERKVQNLALRIEREKQSLAKRDRVADLSNRKYQKEMQRIHNNWEQGLKDILNRKQYEMYRNHQWS